MLVAYLLWPLRSPDFRIVDDPSAMAEKAGFISKNEKTTDTCPPNILLITVDDLGMADVSLYAEGDIETPGIDRLGAGGVIFDNAYVTSPVCSPSRAAIMTGRYQHRFGFEFTMHDRYLKNRLEFIGFRYFINSHPWVPKWQCAVPDPEAIHQQGLPPSEITLADMLQKYGYHTGITGKWHLGWSEEKRPSAFGFEEQYGFFHSHSLYVPEGTPGIVDQKIEGDWTDPHIWSGQRNGAHAIHQNYKVIDERGYLTDRITEESIRFMEKHREEPYFLWISFNAPHTPLQAPKEYVDRFAYIEDPVKRVYRAMISNLDDNIGRLMDYLDANDLDDNTLIFFISDNGGAEYTLTTDNGRYDGGKNTEFEGGVKVPMIIRWKGHIQAGNRFTPMVSSLDIFSTALASAHIPLMPGIAVDGVDLLPYLTDTLQRNPHEYLYWKRGNSEVIRSDRWKLMINGNSGDTLLYDLSVNRFEEPNVAFGHTDIVLELSRAFDTWTRDHRPPMWPPVVYYIGDKDGHPYYFDQ